MVLVSLPTQKFADLTVAADGVLYANETILTEEVEVLAEKLTISYQPPGHGTAFIMQYD